MTNLNLNLKLVTAEQDARRDELEAVVEAGLRTFIEVGQALVELHDGRLYRATHDTFDAYVADRFGSSRQHAYRLIEAAKTAVAVSPMGVIANERQARALAGLETRTRSVRLTRGRRRRPESCSRRQGT